MEDRGVDPRHGQRARRRRRSTTPRATCDAIERIAHELCPSSTASSSSPATRRCRKASRSCAPSTGRSAARRTQQIARELQPQLAALPGVTRVPDHAAEPRAGLSRAAGQLRDRHQRQLREPGSAWRSSSSPRWPRTPAFVQPDTDLRLNKPEMLHRGRSRARGRRRRQRRRRWRARSRPCSAAARSRATSATPSSTT